MSETFFTPQVDALSRKLIEMTPQQTATAMLEAASLETFRGERAPAAWLCRRGMHSVMRALAGGQTTQQGKASEDSLGKRATIDTSGIAPEFKPEEEWRKQRAKILDDFIRAALEKLAGGR